MAEIEIPKPNTNIQSSLIRDPKNTLDNPKKEKPSVNMKGGISKKEPTFTEKLKRSFVKEDIHNIRDYIIFDVVIPSIRKSIFDTVVGTTAQIFGISVPRNFGYSDPTRYGGTNRGITQHERQFRDYNSITGRNTLDNRRITTRYDRFYVEDYPFDYEEDALHTLEVMMDICDANGWVSVSKFFEIVDPAGTITGKNPYTNNNFGWYRVDNGVVKSIPDYGFVISLPPAGPRRMI